MPDERASTTARRVNRAWAVGTWAVAISVFAAQVWVLLDPTADSVRAVFPDWPHDPAYDGYLRAVAWADILFMQPLIFLTGVGLWRMRRWAWVAGVAVGGAGAYFTIIQAGAQLTIGDAYSLYGAGVWGAPFAGTFLAPLMNWISLLPFAVFPVGLGIHGARQLRRHHSPAWPPAWRIDEGEHPWQANANRSSGGVS